MARKIVLNAKMRRTGRLWRDGNTADRRAILSTHLVPILEI
jgi:hypothetical protein